ncbi:hypothetical protein M678_12695 [Neisseria gonorrhoeae SK7461]|nr:hypothetical protein M675_08575 [Neisseria gonorrhoeae SK1902]KLR92028.1 hypothetical protein M678_12695 [Neisseria gonorrhoeae SK7461]KLS55069.1 hypothetical protein M734_11530 [Neisseria gonorrhoeae MIA_2011_02_02]KLS59750.1 hypothetical protein M743_11010 [Neisseria gonorrhoeae NYC_2011_05_13]KLS63835.1 hypothetical protein M739_12505 [Neisseria gonorrhoeae MIA_2011_05-16]KLS81411.1 hypothetical protein M786_12005 [Neisseria gonorrhoeae MU_NG21]
MRIDLKLQNPNGSDSRFTRFKVTVLSEKQKTKAARIYLKQPDSNG